MQEPYRTLVLGVLMLSIATIGRELGGSPELTDYAFAVGLLFCAIKVLELWQLRRSLRELRQMSDEGRERVLGSIPDLEWRSRLAAMVERDLPPLVQDGVESFPFPDTVRRAHQARYWVLALAAVAVAWLLLRRPVGTPPLAWWAAGVAIAALAGSFYLLHRRGQELDTQLELSPFAISELLPDGSRRTMPWQQPLVLRNRPRLRRVELAPAEAPKQRFLVHYDRLRFVHALERIVEYGGFQAREPAA